MGTLLRCWEQKILMLALKAVNERGARRGGEGPEGGPWQIRGSPGACKARLTVPAPQCPLCQTGLRWAPDYLLPKPEGAEEKRLGLVWEMPPAPVTGERSAKGTWKWGCWGPGLGVGVSDSWGSALGIAPA